MKKFLIVTLILCCGLLFLSACGQEETPEPTQEKPKETYREEKKEAPEESEEPEVSYENLAEPEMINADFAVTANADGSFLIETNLPGGTELMLTLKGRGYLAQDKVIVGDGVAVCERFTDKGKQLVGDFTLEVLMPIPSVQSDYVKHFIGERGEYLTGPNVKGALGSVVVSKEFEVSFDGNGDAPDTATDKPVGKTNPDGSYYRTPTGKKYHLDPNCGGKNSYKTNNISGLDPCKKCAV